MSGSIEGVTGLVLAGGLSRRMQGANKAFLPLGQQSLTRHVIDRLQPQVNRCLLSGPETVCQLAPELTCIADILPGHLGPLAGILSGLAWLQQHDSETRWLVSLPCDTPFFPTDLVARLLARQSLSPDALLVIASCEGRLHPVVGLWSVELADRIRDALIDGQVPRMMEWTRQQRHAVEEFEIDRVDPFFNVNRPQDYERAKSIRRAAFE